MLRIEYCINNPVNEGTEENPKWMDNPISKSIPYSEANEELAKQEAHNGEYTIEDDGIEEIFAPTQLDIIEAQITYTAMMTDTLMEV